MGLREVFKCICLKTGSVRPKPGFLATVMKTVYRTASISVSKQITVRIVYSVQNCLYSRMLQV